MCVSEISSLELMPGYLGDFSAQENKDPLFPQFSTSVSGKMFSRHASGALSSESDYSLRGFIQHLVPEIKECYSFAKKVSALCRARIELIRNQIERYRPGIEASRIQEPFFAGKDVVHIDPEYLERIPQGVSGSYFLLDAEGNKRFVVKPIDEDCGCLNNPKGYVTLSMKNPIREDMPLYLSSLKEALIYEAAKTIGIESIAPKTFLAILESPGFSYFDVPNKEIYSYSYTAPSSGSSEIFDQLSSAIFKLKGAMMGYCIEKVGPPPREKLCSAQKYIENGKALFEVQQALQSKYGSDLEAIANCFDQKQFEETNILIWTTYDTDAHAGNILVHPLRQDHQGSEVYGFKKIDNGLAFPTSNRQLRNALSYLPNMNRELSAEGRAKILDIDVDIISEKMKYYGMDSAIPAFLERIDLLKTVAMKEGVTLKEINNEMAKLENRYETSYGFNDDFSSGDSW